VKVAIDYLPCSTPGIASSPTFDKFLSEKLNDDLLVMAASIECDLILELDGQKLRTVQLSAVPRAGDELDLDFGGGQQAMYRVVRVRYHIRPRKLVRTDDIIGVSVFISPAA
jgi:hypothetical protein